MGPSNNSACSRKEMIVKIRKVLDQMDNAKVEARCCCTDPERPGAGKKVVQTACLDGTPGLQKVVSSNPAKYIWEPPVADARPPLDPTMSCHAATVTNQFYDQWQGCRLACDGQGGRVGAHSHWWNEARGVEADVHHQQTQGGRALGPDYCEDASFEAPQPLGRMAWTNEPGGTCRHPQFCKAHCFDHTPERDWAKH